MIKDSGTLLLTKEDLEVYGRGEISQRLKEVWPEVTYDDLTTIIEQNNYKVIDNNGSEATRTEETSGKPTDSSKE